MSNNKVKITAEPNKQELFIEREFDAPRDLVFKVMTDPELLPQWWGPRGHSTEVDKADVRSGGEWRYIHDDNQGHKIGFHGVFHEILKPSRVIQTFEWEGLPETGHVILETAKYEELPNDRTKITIQQVFQKVEDRDGMVQHGMEKGLSESYERLDELLEKMDNKGEK
jgi:uncharacterized protein YndB with AHSA1/START domain